ncbi:MAG: hypothetical protein ACPLKP_01210 [Microgenomates group bacterium]
MVKKIIEKDIFYILIIFLFGFLSISWFKGQYLVNPGDTNFSLNPPNDLLRSLFWWDHQQELGRADYFASFKIFTYNLFLFLLFKTGFSIYSCQKILFYLIFTFSGIGAYFLIKYLLSFSEFKHKQISGLIGANFYMINTYLLQLKWGSGYLMGLFFYAFFPFLILMWFKGKECRNFKFIFYMSLFFLFSLPSLTNPAYIGPFLVIIVLDLLLEFLKNIKKRIKLIYFLKYFLISFLINGIIFTFWILATLLGSFSGYQHFIKSTVLFKQEVTSSSFSSILNLFRNLGDWGFWGKYREDFYYPYSPIYNKWLFILVSFIILFLIFLNLIFLKKQNRETKYFTLFFWVVFLIGIFLSKGIHEPFDQVNQWLLNKFLIFKGFRMAYEKFGPLICISNSILISYSLTLILFLIKRRYIKHIFIFFSFFLVNLYGWPFWTGDVWREETKNLPGFRFKIPNYYEEIRSFLEKQKINFKILSLPDNAVEVPGIIILNLESGLYGGADPLARLISLPIYYLDKFNFDNYREINSSLYYFYLDNPESFALFLKRFSGFLNTKYIFLREESTNKVYLNIRPAYFIKPFIDKFFILERNFDRVAIYKTEDKNFLPHFYISKRIIYSNGKTDNLKEIIELSDDELRLGIYLENSKLKTQNSKLENGEILEKANEILIVGELKNGIDKDYWEKLENFKSKVSFPYVRHKPNSLGWKLAKIKENYEEWKVRKNSEKLIDKKLFFAGKRISELVKFTDDIDNLLIIEEWKKKFEETREEVEKLESQEIKKEQIIKLRAYFERHQEEIKKLKDLKIETFKNWKETFEEIDKKIAKFEGKFDLNELDYVLEIPKEGEYTLYLEIPNSKIQVPNKEENKGLENFGIGEIEIDGEKIEIENFQINEEWIELGKIKLEEGEHKLKLYLLEGINLVGKDWQKLKDVETKEEGVFFEKQGFFPEAKDLVFQPINDWQSGEFYYLSFEYKTEGGRLGLGIVEEKRIYEEEKERIRKEKIFEKKLTSGEFSEENDWQKFERVFQADNEAVGAEIYFYSEPETGKIARVEFRNLQIKKVREPKVILRKRLQIPNSEFQIPKITFIKVNPTKYKIKIEEAKTPYTLVFSESFHEGWKIYLKEAQSAKGKAQNLKFKDLRDVVVGMIGKIGEKVTDLFLDNRGYGEEVASYFDGEIKEGTHRMTFLEPAAFETWGKKSIAEERHYLVNGYANSWYITPEDVGGAENYELIVEFWPQRFFYIGLGISLLTFAGCLSYLGYDFISNLKNKNEKN